MRVCMCVCVCLCVCVCTLAIEPFDLQTGNFTWKSAWTISRSSFMSKVKGQDHEVKIRDFQVFWLWTVTMGEHMGDVMNSFELTA